MHTRRGFIAGILAGASAPAIVKASSLMNLSKGPSGVLIPTPKRFNDFVLDSELMPRVDLAVQPILKQSDALESFYKKWFKETTGIDY